MQRKMRRIFVCFGAVLVIAGLLSGCSDNLKQENAELKAKNAGLKSETQLLQAQIADLKKTIQVLESKQQDLETSHQKTVGLLEDKQHQMEISYKSDLERLGSELAQVKSEAEKLKTKPESTKPAEVKVVQKGRLRFNVTYKYNDFVGNRADVGAAISLQSINSKPILYIGKVGGDGYAVINQIIPGKYLCIITSQNAKSGGSVSPEDVDAIKQYLNKSDADMELMSAAILKKKTIGGQVDKS